MKYVIKHNLPTEKFCPEERFTNKSKASERFFEIGKWCKDENLKFTSNIQSGPRMLRGTIVVRIDEFFYYVELYAV